MELDLPRHTEVLIAALMKSRGFPSVEALIAAAVDTIFEEGIYWDETLDDEDLAAIAEADAEIERGEVVSADEVRAMFLGMLKDQK